MKRVFIIAACLLCFLQAFSQDRIITLDKLNLDTRADFTYENYLNNDTSAHGFQGKYLRFRIDGTITDKFSYHLRQRINTPNIGFANTFFQGTDWAYLNWNLTDQLYLSAGKQVVAIGGWEYDTDPVDIYYGTDFWNHVCCYEMGLSLNFQDKAKRHLFIAQMTNSPFISSSMESIYSYNLMWYGDLGIFKTAYSVNMIEYRPGQFINYISLGNKIKTGILEMYIDLQNRASFEQEHFFGQDFTALIGAGVDVGDKWILFAKAGYDFNKAQAHTTPDPYDQYVAPGRKVDFESLGFEYYPMGDRNLRVHLCGSHTNVDGDNNFQVNLGLTWKVDLLHSVINK